MSAVIETFIICDTGCGRTFGVDNRTANVTQQRVSSKRNGWRYSGGKDYCPECKKRKPKSATLLLNRPNGV